jgi:hypothetical protein
MTSALSRLRELPEAFTFAAFCKYTGLSNNAAAVCLRRWKLKGLVESAGDRAGIYFNKLKSIQIDDSLRIDALLFEYPSATLCGESVLHAAGWITQIPARMSVAVLARASYITLHGFDMHGRSRAWFKMVHDARAVDAERVYGLRALTPAFALADLYKDPKAWHPDVDDLDIPEGESSTLLLAAKMLKVQFPESVKAEIDRLSTPVRRRR